MSETVRLSGPNESRSALLAQLENAGVHVPFDEDARRDLSLGMPTPEGHEWVVCSAESLAPVEAVLARFPTWRLREHGPARSKMQLSATVVPLGGDE